MSGDGMAVGQDLDVDLRIDRPHAARMYDYMIGGKTNFPADRKAADDAIRANPTLTVATLSNRSFLRRCVYRLAAEHGVRQFLDVGTGIPTPPNTHEIAQGVDPTSRVVYVDNDPIVLAHARALMTSSRQGATAYIDADLRDPAAILGDPELRETLDLDRPVALMLVAILHFMTDADRPHEIVKALLDPLPSGSFLVVTHATPDLAPEAFNAVEDTYNRSGVPVRFRTRASIEAFFDGLEMLDGVQLVTRWWPDAAESDLRDEDVSVYAGVARKA